MIKAQQICNYSIFIDISPSMCYTCASNINYACVRTLAQDLDDLGGTLMLKNAKWITSPINVGVAACDFKTDLALGADIKRAVLTVTSIGNYAAYIDGKRVGHGVLTPGFTSYKNRVLYQTYDVTDMVSEKCEL